MLLRMYVPSNDTAGKSTDTEEVERQLYLENSSGAVFTPPEIEVLVGGKRKGGTRNKKRSKKTATNNNNCCGGVRTYHTPLGNGEERRECLKRVALEEMKSRVRKLPHPNPEVDEYKEGFYLLVRKPEVVDRYQ